MELNHRKYLPLGIEDFKVVSSECYYVDKTPLIRELTDFPEGTAILLTRPRRFGKSLTISMLQTFFEKTGEDSSRYFKDKLIWQDEGMRELQGKFPVIHINFKSAYGANEKEFFFKFREAICKEYERHGSLPVSSLPERLKEYWNQLLAGHLDDFALTSSLANLSEALTLLSGVRPLLLIDEYDAPLIYAKDQGYYDRIITFFKNFYSETLKGNAYLKLGIITGVLRISKASLFSGLNNLIELTVLSRNPSTPFGFTQKEAESILAYYGGSSHLEEAAYWYGGYIRNGQNLYNPWSVLSYVQNGFSALPYWTNTASNLLLKQLLNHLSGDGLEILTKLMNGEKIISEISLSVPYGEDDALPNTILALLLSSGYLTAVAHYSGDVYALKLPNEEIRSLFESDITSRFFPNQGRQSLFLLKEALEKGDAHTAEAWLRTLLEQSFSYFDLREEKNYQIIMLLLASLLFNRHYVKSESVGPSGRSDILVIPHQPGMLGMVIELKVSKSRLSQAQREERLMAAMRQITEKKYDVLLREAGAQPIYEYAILFVKSDVFIKVSKK